METNSSTVTNTVLNKKPRPKVLSVIGPKGGIGKTTTLSNLAGLLADLGLRVLVIDTDKQQSLSRQFLNQLPENTAETGLAEILYRGGVVAQENIRSSLRPGIDVIVSNISDEHINWLKERMDSFSIFLRIVGSNFVHGVYDYVLIDTQGSVNVLGKNAGVASDVIYSPLPPNSLDIGTFIADAPRIWQEIDSTCSAINRPLPRICVGYSKANFRLVNDQVMRDVLEPFINANPRMELLKTVIPTSTIYTQAAAMKTPVHRFEESIREGAPYHVMHSLMHELFPELGGLWLKEVEVA